jgi:hypothetical protein
MSLRRLRPSLERLIPRDNTNPVWIAHLESLFLTSRQCSDKYHRLVPEILNSGNSEEPADFEQSMMWLAFKNDKPADESIFGDNEEEKEEKWKKDWLDRVERRESVSSQIPFRDVDGPQGYRFRSSCTCFGYAIPHPILILSQPRALLPLPGNGSNVTSHRPPRSKISLSL